MVDALRQAIGPHISMQTCIEEVGHGADGKPLFMRRVYLASSEPDGERTLVQETAIDSSDPQLTALALMPCQKGAH